MSAAPARTEQASAEPVQLYTDGGCRPNPGPGGWGALLRWQGRERELSGFAAQTTNNRMELTAAVEGLRMLKRACTVDLYTDSKYLQQGMREWLPNWIRRGWKTAGGSAVVNQDLWQALHELNQLHTIRWHWVRAHNGHADNERVDQLATAAMRDNGVPV